MPSLVRVDVPITNINVAAANAVTVSETTIQNSAVNPGSGGERAVEVNLPDPSIPSTNQADKLSSSRTVSAHNNNKRTIRQSKSITPSPKKRALQNNNNESKSDANVILKPKRQQEQQTLRNFFFGKRGATDDVKEPQRHNNSNAVIEIDLVDDHCESNSVDQSSVSDPPYTPPSLSTQTAAIPQNDEVRLAPSHHKTERHERNPVTLSTNLEHSKTQTTIPKVIDNKSPKFTAAADDVTANDQKKNSQDSNNESNPHTVEVEQRCEASIGMADITSIHSMKRGAKQSAVYDVHHEYDKDDEAQIVPTVHAVEDRIMENVVIDPGTGITLRPITFPSSQGGQDYTRLYHRSCQRQVELIRRASGIMYREQLKPPSTPTIGSTFTDAAMTGADNQEMDCFPDELVPLLATTVQGSVLPLSTLCKEAQKVMETALLLSEKKNPSSSPRRPLSLTCISDKIKLIAERKSHFGIHDLSHMQSPVFSPPCGNNLEDVCPQCVWRWEVCTLDVFASDDSMEIRQKRAARRKLASYYKALIKLIQCLHQLAVSCTSSSPSTTTTTSAADPSATTTCLTDEKRDILEKQLVQAEERVLKFEREEEAKRLADHEKEKKKVDRVRQVEESAAMKRKRRDEETAMKAEMKKRRDEERAEAKARKDEEKRAKEEERRLEKEQKDLEMKKAQELKRDKEMKQKALMSKFFVEESKAVGDGRHHQGIISNAERKTLVQQQHSNEAPATQYQCRFREEINSCTASSKKLLEGHIKRCNMRQRCRPSLEYVAVSVVVTVQDCADATSAFGFDQCYSERQVIRIPNKYKFFRFHEDHRPYYRGTWSRKSSLISGKRPFAQDVTIVNYDNISEDEWEEEGEGESVGSVDGEKDELSDDEVGVDQRNYCYTDGWLQEDDDEVDDNSRMNDAVRAGKRFKKSELGGDAFGARLLFSPIVGGLPLIGNSLASMKNCHSNVNVDLAIAMDLLSRFRAVSFNAKGDVSVERHRKKKVSLQRLDHASATQDVKLKDDRADEWKVKFCHFIYGCNLPSKPKLIADFMQRNSDIVISRASLLKFLDSYATKSRSLECWSECVWRVDAVILKQLNVEHLENKEDKSKVEDDLSNMMNDKPLEEAASKKSIKLMSEFLSGKAKSMGS